MKLLVVGSNGRVGSLIVKEALNANMDVTGLAKGENKSGAASFIQKDALFLTKDDVKGFDAIVDAVGGWTPETIPAITNTMLHLIEILSGSNIRLYVVGGAGSLFVNKEHTLTVDMGKDFPDSWKPLSAAHGAGLKALRSSSLNWTYVSPACNFVADGARTGEYQLGGEELILNHNEQSEISYADYALAMVNLIQSGAHSKERVSLCSK